MKASQLTVLVVLLLVAAGQWSCSTAADSSDLGICDMCGRRIVPATAYLIHLADGKVKHACCPRCGLRFEAKRADVVSREAADFTTGERLKAEEAIYVEGSRVHLCCRQEVERDQAGRQYQLDWDRCMPSLIAFRSAEDAERFRVKEGGAIRSFEELRQSMLEPAS